MFFKRKIQIILFFVYFACIWLLLDVFFCTNDDIQDYQNLQTLKNNSWKFKDFESSQWNTGYAIQLKDDNSKYFRQISPERECFIEGTNWDLTKTVECKCKSNYFGNDCGIPDSVWYSQYIINPQDSKHLVRRASPRRIIQSFSFNHEFEMLDIRLSTSYDVVDVYIIQESNFTTIGESKSQQLLAELSKGRFKEYQDKILYIPVQYYLKEWHSNGWLVDDFIHNHVSVAGLPLIENKRSDDLFFLFDSDEIPNRSLLLFLKLYDGYPEPIRLNLRWNIFGFFWLKSENKKESLTSINAGCTLGMLQNVYDNQALNIRKNSFEKAGFESKAREYSQYHRLRTWSIGVVGYYAGFHCSWCFKPPGIRTKLLSAQKEDKPRWGDYPEKIRLPYIASLIKNGRWFDGSFPMIKANKSDPNFAPNYAINNYDMFRHLLEL